MSDLISRQAAIDALARMIPFAIDDISTESYTNGLTDAYNLICQLPSVEPEQKTGEWKEKEVVNNEDEKIEEWQSARCSVCESYHTTPYLYYFNEFAYCPCCGARMKE